MSSKSKAKSASPAAAAAAPAAAAAATSKAVKAVRSGSNAVLSPMSIAGLVLLLAVLLQLSSVPSLTGSPSAAKPYGSFAQFYPFYASEHSDRTNRMLHFAGTATTIVLFALHPRSIPSALMGAAVGFILSPALIGLPHGLVEFAAIIAVFAASHKLSTGRFGWPVLFPIVGYACAWAGHFLHEHNRPATFIYPAYSLAGDFTMFWRILTQQETF